MPPHSAGDNGLGGPGRRVVSRPCRRTFWAAAMASFCSAMVLRRALSSSKACPSSQVSCHPAVGGAHPVGPCSQGHVWHMPLLQTSEMVSATHQRLIVTSSLIGGID